MTILETIKDEWVKFARDEPNSSPMDFLDEDFAPALKYDILGTRRWGIDEYAIYKVLDTYIAVEWYWPAELSSSEIQVEFYEVEPEETVIIEYVRKT